MKTTTITTSLISVLLILIIALSGCGDTTTQIQPTESQPVENQPVENNPNKERTGVIENPTPLQTADASITIEGGKITPVEITIPAKATVLIINKEDTQQRIEMSFYQAVISIDVSPGESEYVSVDSKYEGRVMIKLNGAQIGGVTVV